MLVTFDTSHEDKSWLNLVAFSKIEVMLVTSDTSQDPIGPLLQLPPLAEISKHASTAFLSWALDISLRTVFALVVVLLVIAGGSVTVEDGVALEAARSINVVTASVVLVRGVVVATVFVMKVMLMLSAVVVVVVVALMALSVLAIVVKRWFVLVAFTVVVVLFVVGPVLMTS